ncbi:hypothetical protein MKW92_036416, partial [Papaver armeniacum]
MARHSTKSCEQDMGSKSTEEELTQLAANNYKTTFTVNQKETQRKAFSWSSPSIQFKAGESSTNSSCDNPFDLLESASTQITGGPEKIKAFEAPKTTSQQKRKAQKKPDPKPTLKPKRSMERQSKLIKLKNNKRILGEGGGTLVEPLGNLGEIHPSYYNQNLIAYGGDPVHPLFRPFQNKNLSAFLSIQNQKRLQNRFNSGGTSKVNNGYWKREARDANKIQTPKNKDSIDEVDMGSFPCQRKRTGDLRMDCSQKIRSRKEQMEEETDNLQEKSIFKPNNEILVKAATQRKIIGDLQMDCSHKIRSREEQMEEEIDSLHAKSIFKPNNEILVK